MSFRSKVDEDKQPTWCRDTQYISYGGNTNVTTPVCKIQLDVPEDLKTPVLLYYQLTNFYQNHRRYVKSFDAGQLKGEHRDNSTIGGSDCEPLQLGERLRASGLCNTVGRGSTIVTPFLVVSLFEAYGIAGVTGLMIALLALQIVAVAVFGVEPRRQSLESLEPVLAPAEDGPASGARAAVPRPIA